jgi:hypothetical protein
MGLNRLVCSCANNMLFANEIATFWGLIIYLFIYLFSFSVSELTIKCVIGLGRFAKNFKGPMEMVERDHYSMFSNISKVMCRLKIFIIYYYLLFLKIKNSFLWFLDLVVWIYFFLVILSELRVQHVIIFYWQSVDTRCKPMYQINRLKV